MLIKRQNLLCWAVCIASFLCCAYGYNQIAYAGEEVEINGTLYNFDCAFLLQDLADFEDAGSDPLNSFQFQNASDNLPFPYSFTTDWEVIVEYEIDVTPYAFTVTPPGINLAVGVPDPNKITITPDTTDSSTTEIFPSSFLGVNFVPGQAIWQEEIIGFSGRIIFEKTDQDPSIFVDTPCTSGDKIERDLSIAKTNDLGGADAQINTPFTWSLAISSAIIGFDVPTGTTVVRDNVPADFTIGTISANPLAGISCSTTGNTVECITTAEVRFPEGGTQFTVGIPVTPTIAGTFTNPDGVCAIDPDMVIAEIGEDENGAPIDPAIDNNVCSDTVTVAGVTLVPGVSIVKSADVTTANIGDTITYNYVVSNTGDVELTNLVVTDDELGAITLDATTIAVDGSTNGTATYIVVATDLPGPITNIATVTGDSAAGSVNGTSAEVIVTLSGSPAVEIIKSADVTTANIGDTITYNYVVSNTGDVELTNLVVTDDELGAITLDATTIAVDGSTNGTATYIVVATDLPGPITNIATVTGDSAAGSATDTSSEVVVLLTSAPSMDISKTANPSPADVGDTIVYTYIVENTGDVPLSNVAVMDDPLGAITLDVTTLAPGETAMGTASYEVLGTDFGAPVTNTATATADHPTGTLEEMTSVSVSVGGAPSLSIVKRANLSPANVGDTVIYTYIVENTGDVPITNVAVMDDPLGAITLDVTTLAPGETAMGTASYLVMADDFGAPITNTAVATADYPSGTLEEMTSLSIDVEANPGISILKTAAPSPANVGDTIIYTYVVENTGDMPLSNVAVMDDPLGAITLDVTTLAPGETATGTASYLVMADDFGAPVTNTAVATADIPGRTVEDSIDVSVDVTANPSIEILKTTSALTADAGDMITFTYVVTNTGDIPLTDVTIVDDPLGAVTLDATALAPGETATGTLTQVMTLPDVGRPITNTAMATADYPGNLVQSETPVITVQVNENPALDIEILASTPALGAGQDVTYTYIIRNMGDTTLAIDSVVDERFGEIIYLGQPLLGSVIGTVTLPPFIVVGDEIRIELPYTARVNDSDIMTNTINAIATSPLGAEVTGTDTVSVAVAKASINKTLLSAGVVDVGRLITFEVVVENSGGVDFAGTLVDDYMADGRNCMAFADVNPGNAAVPYTVDETAKTITWDNLSIPMGGSMAFEVMFTITERAPGGGCVNDAVFAVEPFNIEVDATTRQPTSVAFSSVETATMWTAIVLMAAVLTAVTAFTVSRTHGSHRDQSLR